MKKAKKKEQRFLPLANHIQCKVVRSDKSIIRQNIRSKNLYIQRKNIAPRRSKHLALETVREGDALNGAVEME